MLEFVLIFQGRLSTTSHTKMKFEYRRQFCKQLIEFQKHMKDDGAPIELNFMPENQIHVGDFTFLPLVTKDSRRVVDLDITLLSDSEPACKHTYPTGDIDNYLKSLLDGLRMAQTQNEIRNEKPREGEKPFYCLLEDDQLVRKININHHKHYSSKKLKVRGKGNEVFALIKVKISPKYCL